ncbi:MAG TPA: chemotaxis protein CheW [Acidiferrobacterales bacterium]|nr:chemotaxis protein CheW [Acidiferrobacterales bacterium]
MDSVVVFTLEGQRIGLPLGTVERAVRVVDVTPLPKAPQIVRGLINVQGRIVPVVNTRKRFGIPEREVALSDQFLIAHTSTRTVAMWVDTVTGVVECNERDFVTAEAIVPGMEYVKGIVKLADGMILVHDLDTFLSLEEQQSLDQAIGNA